MTGFQDVTSAHGEFHVRVVAPVTYVLHVGGKTSLISNSPLLKNSERGV